ncbi:MAG: YlmC/YmxH family sporulation protein [Bacillus sp. (in: firmicutes)]
MVRISDFQVKDIVNLADGKRLGNLHDLEVDINTGRVLSLIISGSGKWPSLFQREDEIIIPWSKIKKIGKDIIFVDNEVRPLRTIEDEVRQE